MTKTKVTWFYDAENYLIELIEKNPCLWKVNHKLYAKKNVKRTVFEKITKTLKSRWIFEFRHLTPRDIIVKYNSMKSYYRKQKKLTDGKISDGYDESSYPKWEHFHRLSFIDQKMDCETDSTSAEFSDQTDSKDFVITADKKDDVSGTPGDLTIDCKPVETTTIVLQPQQYSTVIGSPGNICIVSDSIEVEAAAPPINLHPVLELKKFTENIENIFEKSTGTLNYMGSQENSAKNSSTQNIQPPETDSVKHLPVQNNSLPEKTDSAKHLPAQNNNLPAKTDSAKHFPAQNNNLPAKTDSAKHLPAQNSPPSETVSIKNIVESTDTLYNLRLQESSEDKSFCVYALSLLQSVKDVKVKRRIQMDVIQLIQNHLETISK